MAIDVDGELQVSAPAGQPIRTAKKGTIGIVAYGPGSVSLSGAMDEIKIDYRVLSREEINRAVLLNVDHQ